eukprot:6900557-Pyramimonas_sp.AAC.1
MRAVYIRAYAHVHAWSSLSQGLSRGFSDWHGWGWIGLGVGDVYKNNVLGAIAALGAKAEAITERPLLRLIDLRFLVRLGLLLPLPATHRWKARGGLGSLLGRSLDHKAFKPQSQHQLRNGSKSKRHHAV